MVGVACIATNDRHDEAVARPTHAHSWQSAELNPKHLWRKDSGYVSEEDGYLASGAVTPAVADGRADGASRKRKLPVDGVPKDEQSSASVLLFLAQMSNTLLSSSSADSAKDEKQPATKRRRVSAARERALPIEEENDVSTGSDDSLELTSPSDGRSVRRREKNREAAQLCRLKKKEFLHTVRENVDRLAAMNAAVKALLDEAVRRRNAVAAENASLDNECAMLRAEIDRLRGGIASN